MSEDARCIGHLKSGEAVYEYTLESPAGIRLKALNFGGIITAIEGLDANHNMRNIVLSLDSLEAYEENPNYIGVLIGRYGGRMNSPLMLNGQAHLLDQNDRGNCLHGGYLGFGKRLWRAEVSRQKDAQTLHLKYLSPSGEGGFPGNFMAHVSYRLDVDGTIQLIYRGISDEDTVVSLTHHNYFNLGSSSGDILNHVLHLEATAIGLLDENQCHQFEEKSLQNHPLTEACGIQVEHLNTWLKENLLAEKGLDHPFRLRKEGKHTLTSEESGLTLEVTTDEDYMVLYAGGYLDETVPFKEAKHRRPYSGICFETQNQPNGPFGEKVVGVLERGELYHHVTTLKLKL